MLLLRSGGKPLLKIEDLQKTKLVEIGWRFGQSYNGGYIAGQMVMNTVANRVRAGWGSWLEVIERVPFFMAENELPPLVWPSVWEGNFVKLLHVVDGVFDGSAIDMSKGALYWGDLNRIERPWFQEKILDALKEDGLRQHPMVANMVSLSFFR
jgi:hypothetical protein